MNQDAKWLIDFAHIHSHLTYANTVWSTHISGKQKKIIEKIQKYCLRSIAKKPHYTHRDLLFKSLKIMKFEDLRHLEQCKLTYKIKNKLMPKPILELFDSLGKKNINTTPGKRIDQTLKGIKVTCIIKAFYANAYHIIMN